MHRAFVSVSDRDTGQLPDAIATKSYQDRALYGNMPEKIESIRNEAAIDKTRWTPMRETVLVPDPDCAERIE